MAYTAPTIKDRVAAGDNKYTMQQLSDGRVLLTPSPDEVEEAGTEINKTLLQPLMNAVAEAWAKLQSLANIATSGSYNDLSDVPHYNVQTINITSASWSNSAYSKAMPSRYFLWSQAAYLTSSTGAACGLFLLVDNGKAYGLYNKYQGSSSNASMWGACAVTSISPGQSNYYICDLSFSATKLTVTKCQNETLTFAYLEL